MIRRLVLLAAVLIAAPLGAQTPAAASGPAGSPAFCLFPVPAENGTQRWINLGIVQYVEARAEMVQLTYGGGNFGSGFDARIPVRNAEEARAVLTRLRQTAEDCMRRSSATAQAEEKK